MTIRTTSNTLFPGLPDYIGPLSGFFSLLHRKGPVVEWSDNVMKRINHIRRHKPASEIQIRLSHIVYLDPRMVFDAEQWKELNAAYVKLCKAVGDARGAKRKVENNGVVVYLRQIIPDFRWNGREIVLNTGVFSVHGLQKRVT